MARYHTTDQGVIAFTSEEEAEWDAMELESHRQIQAAYRDNIRKERNQLLAECDWMVIKSYERNENIPVEWEVYRQALRDITAHEGFPYTVKWPEKP